MDQGKKKRLLLAMGTYSLVRTDEMDMNMGPGTCSPKNSLGDLQGHKQTWKETQMVQGSSNTPWKSVLLV